MDIYAKEKIFSYRILKQNSVPEPLISVIIPFYNVEKYFGDCLQSVLKQTEKRLELICVDDGSDDSSLAILEDASKKDPRITIITQQNLGPAVARNIGLAAARGKYVYFMDSDDILEPEALEILLPKIEAENLDILYFNTRCFVDTPDLEKRLAGTWAYFERTHSYPLVCKGEDMLRQFHAHKEYIVVVWLQLIRRDFLRQNHISFCPGNICDDELFSFTAMLMAQRVGYVTHVLHRYRIRENSIMTTPIAFKNVYGPFVCFLEMQKLLAGLSLADENYKAAFEIAVILLRVGARRYQALAVSEKQLASTLPIQEQLLFRFYVEDHYLKIRELEEKNRSLQESAKRKATDYNSIRKKHGEESNKLSQSLSTEVKKHEACRARLSAKEKELSAIKNGYSFRIGRIITFVPRKLRGGFRCYKEHGFIYTFKRTLWHLGFK